jgi:hypothetical protein
MHHTGPTHGQGIDVSRLPQFLRDALSRPPSRGEGLHSWIFRIARQLHAHGSEDQICELLFAVLADSGAERREILDAVLNSKRVAWQPSGGARHLLSVQPKWPKFDPSLHAEVIRNASGLEDLHRLSPVRDECLLCDPEQLVDLLFPGNPLICCGWSNKCFETKPRAEWRGKLARMQFIVPSPMSSVTGRTQQGKESYRSLSNVGPRRFLVVEFDRGSLDEQAAVILTLGGFAPLVLVVHSGGKSLHAWFFCQGQAEERLQRYCAHAARLGADTATFCPVQLVRMPAGLRENGNTQKVHFLNPNAIK